MPESQSRNGKLGVLHGTIPAIVTPFLETSDGDRPLDLESFSSLTEWLLGSGVSGIVVCGSTGEAATLSDDERKTLIRRTVEIVQGRVPVIAGTGTNCTRTSVLITQEAKHLGADAALAVAPYYNKPTQEGLFQHYSTIARDGGLPVVVYNIPGRSVVEILPATLARLAAVPGIVAIKHAVDSIAKLLEVSRVLEGRLALMAGDDPMTYSVMSVGGTGVISASASIIPREMCAITDAAASGDMASALAAQQRALPIIDSLFAETNPIPIKAGLKMLGHIKSDAVRLPLTTATPATVERLATFFGR